MLVSKPEKAPQRAHTLSSAERQEFSVCKNNQSWSATSKTRNQKKDIHLHSRWDKSDKTRLGPSETTNLGWRSRKPREWPGTNLSELQADKLNRLYRASWRCTGVHTWQERFQRWSRGMVLMNLEQIVDYSQTSTIFGVTWPRTIPICSGYTRQDFCRRRAPLL